MRSPPRRPPVVGAAASRRVQALTCSIRLVASESFSARRQYVPARARRSHHSGTSLSSRVSTPDCQHWRHDPRAAPSKNFRQHSAKADLRYDPEEKSRRNSTQHSAVSSQQSAVNSQQSALSSQHSAVSSQQLRLIVEVYSLRSIV